MAEAERKTCTAEFAAEVGLEAISGVRMVGKNHQDF